MLTLSVKTVPIRLHHTVGGVKFIVIASIDSYKYRSRCHGLFTASFTSEYIFNQNTCVTSRSVALWGGWVVSLPIPSLALDILWVPLAFDIPCFCLLFLIPHEINWWILHLISTGGAGAKFFRFSKIIALLWDFFSLSKSCHNNNIRSFLQLVSWHSNGYPWLEDKPLIDLMGCEGGGGWLYYGRRGVRYGSVP